VRKSLLVAGALAAALLGAARSSAEGLASQPIVTVVRHGGLCTVDSECRTVLWISDTKISATGYRPRRLTPTARAALLRAVRSLDLAYLHAHPFKGSCPIVFDGQESSYRFRGLATPLAPCRYDLHRVEAVVLTERLLAKLTRR
jgi:hypothetical protein